MKLRLKNLFAETITLTKFIIRRDRLRLLIWVIALSAFQIGLVFVFRDILLKDTEVSVMIEMMKNPAMVAMLGPVYGENNYTLGPAYANYMLVFSLIIAAIMNIFLVNRHTRQDEELGRLEIIRSLPVGRLSNLASTLIVAFVTNIILSLLVCLGIFIAGKGELNLMGSFIYGISMGVIGVLFAAITSLLAQIFTNNRTVTGVSFILLFLFYILRAFGDVSNETLSLISPLGLILRTENFVKDKWFPIIIVKFTTLIITAISFILASTRNLGTGLLPEKGGRKHGSFLLSTPLGLAFKLLRTPLFLWAVVIYLFSAMYGSVFGELETFIDNNEMLKAMFSTNLNFSLTEQFIGLLTAIMSMISSIPLLNYVNRIAGEEKFGRAEIILTKSVSRQSFLKSYFIPAFIASIVYQLLAAYGFWSVGSMVMDNIPSMGTFLKSSLLYLPAIWVMIGLGIFLIGISPRISSITYIYLGYTFFAIYLGKLANLPKWVKELTPFGHIPEFPIEEIKWLNLFVMSIAFLVLTSIGFVLYRRRDIVNG